MISSLILGLVISPVSATTGFAGAPYRPDEAEVLASYKRADNLRTQLGGKAFRLSVVPHWYDEGKRLWYTNNLPGGGTEYVSVDSATGAKQPAFDQVKLASLLSGELGHSVDAKSLPLARLTFTKTNEISFDSGGFHYTVDLDAYKITKGDAVKAERRPRPEVWSQDLHPPETEPMKSPDSQFTARISGNTIRVKPATGDEYQVAEITDGPAYFYHLEWRPDSKKLVAYQVTPGDRRPVYLIQATPPQGGRAVLKQRIYDLPGDKTDAIALWVCDPIAKSSSKVQADPIDYGDTPYPHWANSGHDFTYEKMDRGFQRWRIVDVDTDTATSKALVDDQNKTFVDSTTAWAHICANGEILWRSERDGWGHLYLSDANGKIGNQITKGEWVVRGVTNVDEKTRTIIFEASGMNKGEDPYFIHYYKVGFDGSGLTPLTPAPGNHHAEFSPDWSTLVDTYSTATNAPVHELRKVADGSLTTTLEKSDIAGLKAAGWTAPEVFVAKGRDGKTDIWGIVYRPSNMDAHKSYPIIEDIYAGPQDSFTPKDFAPYRYDQSIAELGFVVVQMDGMGTRNRGKAFHDVCWKNISDAGFPDRILWMKALAKKYAYLDINRVGVFGTSAGGQNSTAALLFHPEFYKVAVSSCGCHDNRMDKLWWNEQWMGYPLGPEYSEDSNITNAWKLKGQLLLMVGELDTNVPPESTYRLTDALMKAGKEFSFLSIPNSDHTAGGPYGERKRRDFFVKNLLGVPSPNWNQEAEPPGKTR